MTCTQIYLWREANKMLRMTRYHLGTVPATAFHPTASTDIGRLLKDFTGVDVPELTLAVEFFKGYDYSRLKEIKPDTPLRGLLMPYVFGRGSMTCESLVREYGGMTMPVKYPRHVPYDLLRVKEMWFNTLTPLTKQKLSGIIHPIPQ